MRIFKLTRESRVTTFREVNLQSFNLPGQLIIQNQTIEDRPKQKGFHNKTEEQNSKEPLMLPCLSGETDQPKSIESSNAIACIYLPSVSSIRRAVKINYTRNRLVKS